jgi:16S rRNA (uracil1498-N3)-methyltransferase
LRHEVGDKVEVVNGKGQLAEGRIVQLTKSEAVLEITEILPAPLPPLVELAFAIPKGAALDTIVHRCTEIGVKKFQPLITAHSIHPDKWNLSRWEKVIAEVGKQCQEVHFPKMENPLTLENWLKQSASKVLILLDEANRTPQIDLRGFSGDLCLILGAEGGWNDSERTLFQQYSTHPLGLGKNRLRTETAAIVGLTLLKSKIGEI